MMITHHLHGFRDDLEICRDIASEHTPYERFDVSTDIRLGRQQMTLVGDSMWVFMSVRHDDMRLIRFDLSVSELQNSSDSP